MSFYRKKDIVKYAIILFLALCNQFSVAQENNNENLFNSNIGVFTPTNFLDSLTYSNEEIILNKYLGNFLRVLDILFSSLLAISERTLLFSTILSNLP